MQDLSCDEGNIVIKLMREKNSFLQFYFSGWGGYFLNKFNPILELICLFHKGKQNNGSNFPLNPVLKEG